MGIKITDGGPDGTVAAQCWIMSLWGYWTFTSLLGIKTTLVRWQYAEVAGLPAGVLYWSYEFY